MARVPLLLLLSLLAVPLHAARLTSISVLDRDYVVVQISDGDVVHNESPVSETVTRYTPALDTGAAMSTGSWTITSSQDASYGGAGRQPTVVYRKTKLSGHGQMEWTGSDFRYALGTLCDNDKLNDHQDQEDNDPYHIVSANHEVGEGFHHVARVGVQQNRPGCGHVHR